MIKSKYDAIVIGAGHAGLEAAFILARLKKHVALITINESTIGQMPCNPSIGGPAKGIVTREIDVLGGMQAKAADATQLQMKLLNSSKGAAVRALRAQIDKIAYHNYFVNAIKENKYIDLILDKVETLIIENKKVKGVKLKSNQELFAPAVIITTGTYLRSKIHIGDYNKAEGPCGNENSHSLSNDLKQLGFELIRLKTGTPPRIKKDSIDYSKVALEPGTNAKLSFSHYQPQYHDFDKQWPCYLTYTNEATHQIINDNLTKSAMFSGSIEGTGPRYCPSIEDKVHRFNDKPRHQIFIEPESKSLDTMYLAGLSTSLPKEIQDEILKTIPGLENAVVDKYAYAIEYDAINPIQLWPTLESKLIENLYFAGQINGTSGYEEAACQGLMVGINLYLKQTNQEPFILGREEAYIGVLIDDLINKGVTDPYRLLTSRAEHRLLLRNDNVEDRLIDKSYQLGLIDKAYYDQYLHEKEIIENTIKFLEKNQLGKFNRHQKFKRGNITLKEWLRQQDNSIAMLIDYLPYKPEDYSDKIIDKINIQVKYEGYINNQKSRINQLNKLEHYSLESIKDYRKVPNLSLEAIDKLNKVLPLNLGQASRISGINMNDLVAIKYYLDNLK